MIIVGGVIYMSGPSGKAAIKSIVQKIKDLCTPEDKDPRDEQQEQEEAVCTLTKTRMKMAQLWVI